MQIKNIISSSATKRQDLFPYSEIIESNSFKLLERSQYASMQHEPQDMYH